MNTAQKREGIFILGKAPTWGVSRSIGGMTTHQNLPYVGPYGVVSRDGRTNFRPTRASQVGFAVRGQKVMQGLLNMSPIT